MEALPPPQPQFPQNPLTTGQPSVAARHDSWRQTLLIIVTFGLLFIGWQWHETRNELRRTQSELATRLKDSDAVAAEARTLARQSQEQLQAQQAKLGAIEARQSESQNQQAALESVYQEFSRARDERALADVDQAIGIAAQQLQLAGNVPSALSALQNAEARLATLDRPQLLPLRKSIARDIDRLKALPLADLTALALQLETMIGRVDALPLGFEHTPPSKRQSAPVAASKPVAQPRPRGSKPAPVASTPASVPASAEPLPAPPGFFSSIAGDIWNDFRELIRIERMDRPDPALLAPSHAAFLRENIRLRLLSARLALLQRDSKVFAEDLRQLRNWLERYFDVQARPVALMLAELKQMEGAQLQIELPALNETEAILRSLKLGQR